MSIEPTPPGPVHIALEPDDRAPGQARRAARDTLTSWDLTALVDPVVLAVSELVTNAVRYGRPPMRMELRLGADDVDVLVYDAEPPEPARLPALPLDPWAESGRGLAIVQALAGRVGCEPVSGDGKVVFASFPTSGPAPAP